MTKKIVSIGGELYIKITPPWIKGYRPATTYVKYVSVRSGY